MPQEFQVLCCYKCDMFQVHHMKKAKKWQCKICNEKQSFIKVYKISSAPDCRSLCQKLNMQRGGVKFDDETNSEGEADDSFTNEQLSADFNADRITGFEDQSFPKSELENECFFDQSSYVDPTDNISLFSSSTIERKTSKCFQGTFVQPAKTTEFYRGIKFERSNIFADNSFKQTVKLDNSKESHKHPLEIKTDISSESHIIPPLKKKRGFEMIKNVKYFQGEISQNTEASKLNWNINFKQSDIFAKEETFEAVDSIENKESCRSSFEVKANVSPQSQVMLPAKKNWGFQMIKNAAAKLN